MPDPQRANPSLFVALVHETLNAEDFASIADLSEAVKQRAARLRLYYDVTTITDAIATVAHTREITRRIMSSINQKLGLRPSTRKRQATKSAALVSDAVCPKCGGRHVIQNTIHGVVKRLCGWCSHSWIPTTPGEAG